MKASIDRNGILIVQAETELEAFALECWNEQAWVEGNTESQENFLVRGSKIQVCYAES